MKFQFKGLVQFNTFLTFSNVNEHKLIQGYTYRGTMATLKMLYRDDNCRSQIDGITITP